jgi:CRP-like cAMP-binding protein
MNTETLSEIRAKLSQIDGLVAYGCTLEEACGCLDVTARTYRRWREVVEFSRVDADEEPESLAAALPDLEAEFGRTMVGAGEILFARGDLADCMYVVASGSVYVPELDARVDAGGIVGEIGVFSEYHARTATALTATDCELVRIPRERAIALSCSRPALGLSITQIMADRLTRNLADARATVARLHVAGIY